jgi:uncharacterized protein YabN with tetrapyrrole methylase and pyrophosphatase domain
MEMHMRIFVTTAKGAAIGAAAGAGIAILMISLDNMNLGRISIPLSSFIDRAVFRVCPLYALGFTDVVKSMTSVIIITIISNALLYGALFALIVGGVALFRRVARV